MRPLTSLSGFTVAVWRRGKERCNARTPSPPASAVCLRTGSYLRGAVRPSRCAAEGQITNPLRDQVFRELEQPPKSVRVEDMETNASASLPRAELVPSSQLRQRNAFWVSRAEEVRQESRRLRQHSRALRAEYQYWRQHYSLIACAWCEKPIRWQYLEEPWAVPATSHSICPTCFATELRALGLREP